MAGAVVTGESAIRASRLPSDEGLCEQCGREREDCFACGLPWHGDRPLLCPQSHAGHDFTASRPPLTDSDSQSVAEARLRLRDEISESLSSNYDRATAAVIAFEQALIAAVRAESRPDAALRAAVDEFQQAYAHRDDGVAERVRYLKACAALAAVDGLDSDSDIHHQVVANAPTNGASSREALEEVWPMA